jgi:hypothetical protein
MIEIPARDAHLIAMAAQFPDQLDEILPKFSTKAAKSLAVAVATGRGTKDELRVAADVRRWVDGYTEAVLRRRNRAKYGKNA